MAEALHPAVIVLAESLGLDVAKLREQYEVQKSAFIVWFTRVTWAQRLVALLLVCTIGAWATALNMIQAAEKVEERADSASARTPWSSKRSGQIAKWFDVQQKLASECAEYQPATRYDVRSRLVLLGDSITEAWRGTAYGEKVERANGTPLVLQQTLAARWKDPIVLGISGDQTQHVLWRLAHGELTGAMARDPRLLVVLLIGTNNLAAGHSPADVAKGILAVTTTVLNQTRARVLLHGILPRGDGARALARLCPPHCDASGQAYRSFREHVWRANELLAALVAKLPAATRPRVRYADCGGTFDTRGSGGVSGSAEGSRSAEGSSSSGGGGGGARPSATDGVASAGAAVAGATVAAAGAHGGGGRSSVGNNRSGGGGGGGGGGSRQRPFGLLEAPRAAGEAATHLVAKVRAALSQQRPRPRGLGVWPSCSRLARLALTRHPRLLPLPRRSRAARHCCLSRVASLLIRSSSGMHSGEPFMITPARVPATPNDARAGLLPRRGP